MKTQTGLDRLLLKWFAKYGSVKAAGLAITFAGIVVKGTIMYTNYQQDQKEKAEKLLIFEQKADRAATISERVETKLDAFQAKNSLEFKKMADRDSIQMNKIEALAEKKTFVKSESETIVKPSGIVKQIEDFPKKNSIR